MKIKEICRRYRNTEGGGTLTALDIEVLAAWLVENLFHEFGKQLVIVSPSRSLASEFERRSRQRRRKRPFAAGPAEVSSHRQNDAAVAPAADAGTADAAAAAPMAMGGPALG